VCRCFAESSERDAVVSAWFRLSDRPGPEAGVNRLSGEEGLWQDDRDGRCPRCRERPLRAHLGRNNVQLSQQSDCKAVYARFVPRGLNRFHRSRQSHFLTFSCYHRQPYFDCPEAYDLFVQCLEVTRRRFGLRIYGYVVMPEHVHLLVSEPGHGTLADTMRELKLSFSKRVRSQRQSARSGSFWQKRYYDRNVRDGREFSIKLRYLHRNPVKRGLVKEPGDWKWSSFRHYAFREIGAVEIESEWTARDRETAAGGGSPRIFLSPR
jgi:putative transposase